MHIYLMQRSKKLFFLAFFVFLTFSLHNLYAQAADPCPEPVINSSAPGPICKGNEIVLTAVFDPGPEPENIEYQWLFNGEELENQTSATLTVVAADTTEGEYTVRITGLDPDNTCTAVTSQPYSLEISVKAGFRENKEAGEPQPPYICLNHVFYAKDTTVGVNLTREWLVSRYGEEPIAGQLPTNSYVRTFPEDLTEFFTADSIAIEFSVSGAYQVQLVIGSEICENDTASTVAKVGYPIVTMPMGMQECSRDPVRIQINSQIMQEGQQPDPTAVAVDQNFGTVDMGSIQWSVRGGDNFTFFSADPNLDVTLPPSRNPYIIKYNIRNECGFLEEYPEELWENETQLFIFPIPDAPEFTATIAPVCDGGSAVIPLAGPLRPGSMGAYWWYQEMTGGQPIGQSGPGFPFTTGPLISTGTAPTSYFFYASTINEFGCESETRTAVEVTVLPPVSNNVLTSDNQEACGSLTPSPITGTVPRGGLGPDSYTYRWQRSVTGADGTFAPAPGAATQQNYTFAGPITETTWFRRIVRSGACDNDTSNVIQITVTPAITNNTISGNQQICSGETPSDLTGSVPAGGAPDEAMTFRWESSVQSPDAGFGLAAGDNTAQNYTSPGPLTETTWYRRVAISGGCQVPSNVVEIVVTPLIANNVVVQEQTLCPGEPAAVLAGSTPTNAGATPGFRWESSTQGPLSGFRPALGTNNERDFSPGVLEQTTWFRRIVQADNACRPDTSDAVQITVITQIADNRIAEDQTICIDTTPEPFRGLFPIIGVSVTYRWEISTTSAELGFGPAPGTNNTADYSPGPISQQTWFRRVVIVEGCSNISNAVTVQVVEIPSSPIVSSEGVVCPGGRANLRASTTNGITLEWFLQETGGNPVFVGENFQTPPLTASTVYYVQARNANDCVSAVRSRITAVVAVPEMTISEDVEIIQGRHTELRATGGVSYSWFPAAGLNDPNTAMPIARPERTTTYRVTVTTEFGCVITDEVTVTVIPAIDVPNAFTPNRDGVNEVWEIRNIQNFPEATVEVYNRWGQRLFRSEGYAEPWDGRFNGQDLPVATYYYIIHLNRLEAPISGSVTIIR
jgi:gliding motility-associated-like protein